MIDTDTKCVHTRRILSTVNGCPVPSQAGEGRGRETGRIRQPVDPLCHGSCCFLVSVAGPSLFKHGGDGVS